MAGAKPNPTKLVEEDLGDTGPVDFSEAEIPQRRPDRPGARRRLDLRMSPAEAAKLGGTPAKRAQIQDIRLRAARMKDNPFLGTADESGLPDIPEHDGWAYFWGRAHLDGKQDARRLQQLATHRLRYEPAPFEQMSEASQAKVAMLMIKEGQYQGFVGIDDTILMRCPAELREQYVDYQQFLADEKVKKLLPGARADFDKMGAEMVDSYIQERPATATDWS